MTDMPPDEMHPLYPEHPLLKAKEEAERPLDAAACSASSVNGLRWHKLTSISIGGDEVEILAATCIDGIGVIVRWVQSVEGWHAMAVDTEGCAWYVVDQSDEGNEIPPEPPTVWDDLPQNR